MASSTTVSVIAMGGTIDKEYAIESASLGVVDPFAAWIQPELRLTGSLPVVQLASKDSLELGDSDRDRLVDHLIATEDTRLVITHGTDTLIDTASAVRDKQRSGTIREDKSIVFTGAFRPGRYYVAEASFNLGHALALAQIVDPGVYVAAGGEFGPVERVRHVNDQFVYG